MLEKGKNIMRKLVYYFVSFGIRSEGMIHNYKIYKNKYYNIQKLIKARSTNKKDKRILKYKMPNADTYIFRLSNIRDDDCWF